MKAVVLHEYGPASNLKYEDFADPKPGEGEVLVHVSATSVNPVDWKQRSGAIKERMPLTFPAILGRDVSGVVREAGAGVTQFKPGDRVMGNAPATYAELCVVTATELSLVPEGLEMPQAAAVPLVALTGDQLVRIAAKAESGQTILLAGALGSVGRCAAFCASEMSVKVIAGVRKSQLEDARKLPGVIDAIALDDEAALEKLGLVDAVANTLMGGIVDKLIAKVKQGGVFGSVADMPSNAALHPTVTANRVMAQPNAATVEHYARAVRDKKLVLPIDELLPLAKAAEAHKIGEKGGVGKLVLIA